MACGSSGLAAHLRRDSSTSAPGLATCLSTRVCSDTARLPQYWPTSAPGLAASARHVADGRCTRACRHELLRREAEYFREAAANEAVSAAEVIR